MLKLLLREVLKLLHREVLKLHLREMFNLLHMKVLILIHSIGVLKLLHREELKLHHSDVLKRQAIGSAQTSFLLTLAYKFLLFRNIMFHKWKLSIWKYINFADESAKTLEETAIHRSLSTGKRRAGDIG